MRFGFRDDKRGVSALVGAVLLLGILVIALASYQAIIVPQQNAQTEFDHNQQVEDEMVEFRNALLEARLDNRERAPSVKLGTRYQSRTLAVNPPPATGTLQSTGQNNNNISVNGTSADEDPIDFNLTGNQFFEYTPSYSEYRDAGTIRYENTLVYHDFGSDNVTLSNQRLLTGESPSGFDVDGTIRLVPSEPEINEQGTDRVSYEPAPERARFVTVTDPEITLPTELPVEDPDRTSWNDLLDGQVDESEISEGPNGELVLKLEGDYLIKYSFIGDTSGFPDDERESPGRSSDDSNPPPSVIDDEIVFFDGLPTAQSGSGINDNTVTFDYQIADPSGDGFGIRLAARVQGAQSFSERTLSDVQGSQTLDVSEYSPPQDTLFVEITLFDNNDRIIDRRSGRISGNNEETILT